MLGDIRFALRALRGAPGFTITAILVLALGIGATAAMFSVVDAVLLRPLPYREPDRLVAVTSSHPRDGDGYPPSVADFEDWRRTARGFDGMALARGEALLKRGAEGATALIAAHVSDGWFDVLGVRPLLGRTFTPEEGGAAAPHVLVLGYDAWQRDFGGDRDVVGRTADFAEGSYTIVGVLPPAATWPQWADAYAPLATLPARREALVRREARIDNVVVARLAPGTGLAAARASIAAAARAIEERDAAAAGWTARLQPLHELVIGTSSRPLWVLLGAVGTVLLIACANVANLQVVRATARRPEMAVRAALGASRWRLARQLLAESLTLAAIGAAAGLVLASWLVSLVRRVAGSVLPRVPEIVVDGRVVLFAAAVTAATALLAGLVPALVASRAAVGARLREGGRGAGRGGTRRPVRAALVVGEIAMALVLLVGAGLLLRSFARLQAVDAGFDPAPLLAVRFEPPKPRYDTPEKLAALQERLVARVAALPGVARVGFTNHVPLAGASIPTKLAGPGAPADGPGSFAIYRTPDAGYFAALGQPLVRGRGFGAAEMTPTSAVVVVNETLARQRWGTVDVVGRGVTYFKQAQGHPDYGAPVSATVIGVARDVAFRSLGEPPAPELYVPSTANPWRWGYLVVRASGDPAALAAAVRRAVAAEDRDIAMPQLLPMARLAANGIADRRLTMGLLAGFAAAALLLAVLGVYGVMAYAVTQRTHEFGIRAALGASPAQVRWLVVAGGARLTAAGLVAGLALALLATRTLDGLLFGIAARDLATFAGGAAVLAAAACLAAWIPARRAARLAPAQVLRAE